jgi:hypothetical protein
MARDFSGSPSGVDWYMTASFKLAYAGLGLSGVAGGAAIVLAAFPSAFMAFLSVLLMVAGLLCAGGGVWWELTHPGPDNLEERSKTGSLVALASGTVLFSYLVLKLGGWDSLEDWMLVLWGITGVAVPVLMLPRVARRAIISCLVVFHFGGILTATTAVPAPGQPAPWLPTLVWNNVYRKYLTFFSTMPITFTRRNPARRAWSGSSSSSTRAIRSGFAWSAATRWRPASSISATCR